LKNLCNTLFMKKMGSPFWPQRAIGVSLAISLSALVSFAQQPRQAGPYLANIVAGGPALVKPLPANLAGSGARTEELWVRTDTPDADALIAGIGDPAAASCYFQLRHGDPGVGSGSGASVLATTMLSSKAWHLLAVSDDGETMTFYVDGMAAGTAHSLKGDVAPEIRLAPNPGDETVRFSGEIGGFSVMEGAKPAARIAHDYAAPPDFDAQLREENAKPWPVQTKQQVGYREPQAPDLMPHGAAAEAAHAQALPPAGPTLRPDGLDKWEIAANWKLYSNVDKAVLPDAGAKISLPGFNDTKWLPATVPGTVLTTLIDRGIYPDPDFGLNNLAIPESLNKHDYWYRVEFPAPADRAAGRHFALHFGGINYSADVWVNGHRVGEMRGAFERGVFDVTNLLYAGTNVLAVRVAPPPHPGIPAEQSIKDGPGYDGGVMLIDGPTFVDTEGWDWMPAIRDRDTGIWQSVSLEETGTVTLGDPQVITRLSLPDTSAADVQINIPVHNDSSAARRVMVTAAFEGVQVRKEADVASGDSTLHLTPDAFPALHLSHPRLWWPNGYGDPNLYHLRLTLSTAGAAGAGAISDQRSVTFGVREVTYELTLFDGSGHLHRVEADPTLTLGKDYDPVDVRHEDMRETATGWASTIDPAAENTPAIRPVTDEPGLTDLVIKVNGVRIAVRGGNWGMDDSRKRVSRAHLEPYFRLHREAHLNMIRNWVGQNTEEVFYQLADEYGMMVWNDFWGSTQNYNAEPGDPDLFIENARDTVRHYRNHPSIVVWCGRNEGVPPPVLNEKLIHMFHEEDGTRFYSPSSNAVNLRPSGPYHWVDPTLYFSKLNRGFSVELGIASFPTREAFEHTVAASDRWPVSDAWAYHDWHQSEGGNTQELMRQLALQLGPFDSLPEFERRIQLFNYVDHQAIYEGMYAHLWKPNSGRMIWMTQPAWPSTMWQMYSSDYDTQASFYGIRKANAPLHVQMDLSDHTVQVVNTTRSEQHGLHVLARVVSPQNETLATQETTLNASANATTPLFVLPIEDLYKQHPLVFVRLELRDSAENLLADNFYWIARDPESNRGMDKLGPATLSAQVSQTADVTATEGAERAWCIRLKNNGSDAAIALKLTALHADGTRLLPAYYSDNYISLLPGEKRTITVQAPTSAVGTGPIHFSLRGWNLADQTVAQDGSKRVGSAGPLDSPLDPQPVETQRANQHTTGQ
jgi:hypothetical protein